MGSFRTTGVKPDQIRSRRFEIPRSQSQGFRFTLEATHLIEAMDIASRASTCEPSVPFGVCTQQKLGRGKGAAHGEPA
jgi:hypothetical protein